MKIIEQISYEEIYQYLTGKKEIERINTLSEEIPGYGIFKYIQKSCSPLINFNIQEEFTFSEAEGFLEDYFAGILNEENSLSIKGTQEKLWMNL